ncbi:MAG: polysaccharide biosynthesis tyrosine autokinase [Ginsengibacter sp.]
MEEKELYSGSSGGGGLSIKENIRKYLAFYPLFIISVIVCVGTALIYLKYAVPQYRATALLFVKKDNKNSNDLIETAITGDPLKSNLDNEIQLMNSTSLMQRVVSKNEFNISYIYLGNVRNTDLYKDAPFRLIPQEIKDSGSACAVKLSALNNEGGMLENSSESNKGKTKFKWNVPFTSGPNSFSFVKHGKLPDKSSKYLASWKPVSQAAGEIKSKMDITLLDKKTSIIQLGILCENVALGKAILNAFAGEYNLSDIEDRNVVSQNTIRFIDDRLGSVSSDLTGVEGKLENYQGNKGLIDVQVQSSQSFSNSNELNKQIADNNLQQGVTQSIMSYFNNPNAEDKFVPSTLGIQDPTLANLIATYNELQLRKQKEAPTLAEGGIVMKDLNNQLSVIKGSVLEALQNINRNLKQTESSLQHQNGQYRQFLSGLPSNQRQMQEIKRKQSITEGLYLYLLQKREEAAVSSTSSNVPNYKQIDPAKGFGPISPNTTNIKIYSVLLGLILPFGIIYLRDLMNDKIMTRKDITHRIETPIVGEITHLSKKQSDTITIMDRDLIGEEFRIIRTNLYFLLEKKDKKVILVTSSVAGEGKSSISLNLAGVLAIPGKKVALLEFDMRKPTITKKLKIVTSKGLNDYFKGNAKDLSEIYNPYEEIPSLHIYHSGATPKYPGDLFLSDRLPVLFEALKSEYDYIIVDSAPVGIVSDALVLGKYVDTVLFVIRQRYTLKKQLDFVNELSKTNKLNNLGIIFNDVKRGGRIGYYGYGHTYGKNYGYEEKPKNKKLRFRKEKPAAV